MAIFNVLNYGALGNGVANDTAAIRAALAAATADPNPGTVYFPAGTYKVAPTQAGEYTFIVTKSNITFEGAGRTLSILSFSAWGMQDPTSMMLDRGGAFRILPPPGGVTGTTFRGIRVTGNAPPTPNAGNWYGNGQLDGWDLTHKGLAIFGPVTNVLVEDCMFDNWRGEVLFAGGGIELGPFTIRNTIVHGSNASAISMTGQLLIEGCEIYNVYNGTENLSFPGQHSIIRNCLVEPNRSLATPTGQNGIVYAGFFLDTSLLVENCVIKNSDQAGLFLSESAHNVTIRNNIFEDNTTSAIYAIFLGQSVYQPFWVNRGYKDILIENNQFRAVTQDAESAIAFFLAESGEDWTIRDNTVTAIAPFSYKEWLRFPGPIGTFIVEGNTLNNVPTPYYPYGLEGPRAVWTNNTLTGITEFGQTAFDYNPDIKVPIEIAPLWDRFQIIDLQDGTNGKIIKIPAIKLQYYYPGFTFELRRKTELRSGEEGLDVTPDASWNTLNKGYMLYTGSVLTMRMGLAGKFMIDDYVARSGAQITQTETPYYIFDPQMMRFDGFNQVTLAPVANFLFNSVSGVPENTPVTINYNANTRIKHRPGVISLSNKRNFIPTGSGSLPAVKINGVLRITVP